MDIKTLEVTDVLKIHEILVSEFAQSGDPIVPAGPRPGGLLESAVTRQFTSLGNVNKYPDPISNAAALVYGLCCNHPFHNGNKRTALVSLLVHLDRNKYTLTGTDHRELYNFILDLADHRLIKTLVKGKNTDPKAEPEQEMQAIQVWLKKHIKRIQKGEKQITYRQLKQILGNFNYGLENPKGNSIDLIKYEEKRIHLFSKERIRKPKRIGSIGYPGDTHVVALNTLKLVRKMCNLTEDDGYDYDTFYNSGAIDRKSVV